MPYTPPSSTPVTGHPSPKVDLPRSSSYFLHQSRRSPSFQDIPAASHHLQNGQSDQSGRADTVRHEATHLSVNPNVRQSPPPISSGSMPVGAILSPPDSAQTSSDDEDEAGDDDTSSRAEGLNEFKAAFRRSLDTKFQFPRSPTDNSSESQPEDDDRNSDAPTLTPPPRLSPAARKISHSRSTTESSFFVEARGTQSAPMSQHTSDDSDEEASDSSNSAKPPLLRKKSGELVKPAIRPPSRRKHSSMPGTPTYAKAVHFNDDIAQVRHFLQVDKPIAVSAGASPVDGLEDEAEFPFSKQASSSVSWEIRLANFPRESLERMSKPVRLERVFLSPDQRSLIGIIAVANIAFHKVVVARFTLDYWKTTSEVMAEFSNDTRLDPRKDGYDQFNFAIKLADQANLENKTMLLCIRYNVNGSEHWDNNDNTNFQIDFVKKKSAEEALVPGLGSTPIPRSRHNSSSSSRPRSVPSLEDDFANSFDPSSIRLRASAAGGPVLPDTPPPPTRRQHGTTQQFGSRYDFGASLSAALSQAQAQLGDRSGIKQRPKPASPQEQNLKSEPTPTSSSLARPDYIHPSNSGVESPRPDSLLATKQALDSRAYQEFVSKFCFFGSGKPQNHASSARQHRSPSGDGTTDDSENLSQVNGSLSPPSGLSPAGSGTSSPLPVTGTGLDGRSSPLGLGYSFHHGSPSGLFTPESQTPTVIQG